MYVRARVQACAQIDHDGRKSHDIGGCGLMGLGENIGCIDSVECGTVEWNSGTVEWWNSGMVGWSIDDPLLLCRCHSNKHACAFWR